MTKPASLRHKTATGAAGWHDAAMKASRGGEEWTAPRGSRDSCGPGSCGIAATAGWSSGVGQALGLGHVQSALVDGPTGDGPRSEERRVGKEWRCRRSAYQYQRSTEVEE